MKSKILLTEETIVRYYLNLTFELKDLEITFQMQPVIYYSLGEKEKNEIAQNSVAKSNIEPLSPISAIISIIMATFGWLSYASMAICNLMELFKYLEISYPPNVEQHFASSMIS